MLKIVLHGKGKSSGSGQGAKPLSGERVTVACPDHLVLADLPVAKSIGSVPATSRVKTVGCRVHRRAGEKVHFCVCCDFPIAIYGRLSPCEHAFCLDCARSGSKCHICEERVQKIQAIKREEGVFICGNPRCRKSFLEKAALQTHIQAHINEINATADSTIDNKDQCLQPKGQPLTKSVIQPNPPPVFGQIEHHPSESQPGNSKGFDRPDQIPNKQKGILSETPFPEYSMHYPQPPNLAVPYNLYSLQTPPFAPGPAQPLYGGPMVQSNSATEVGSEQGLLLGLPPGPASGLSFSERYSQPWNTGPVDVPIFLGNSGYPGVLPSNLPTPYSTHKRMELAQAENSMGPRDGKVTFAPQSVVPATTAFTPSPYVAAATREFLSS